MLYGCRIQQGSVMGPHDSDSSCGSSASPAGAAASMDGLLATTGYKVRPSNLRRLASRLECLETAMVKAPPDDILLLSSDAVHRNPSDMAAWVDSMLSELYSPLHPLPSPDLFYAAAPDERRTMPLSAVGIAAAMEEDSGIRLVYLLMTCAESVQRGDHQLACCLFDQMRGLLTSVNTAGGIGKVAGYFIDALRRRIFSPPQTAAFADAGEDEMVYHAFYEACPYLKFAHFTANQAILEAFDGCDCVHVVDFGLMQGLQWPPLIQALALRPGGPPALRLTGIGPPSPDGRDSLREIGLRLGQMARSVNVRFTFRGVAAARLQDVRPWMLQVRPAEAVAVNFISQLHRLLSPADVPPVEEVLGWVWDLSPRIVTVVEQEADHNRPEFLDRFTRALYYYSTVFDSLEAAGGGVLPEKAAAEMYVVREIRNVVCCEGADRVERHEPLVRWRDRLARTGFRPVCLGSNAFEQARVLLTLSSADGYCVQENEGCLTLGWHDRPLIAASAWRPSC